MASADSLPPPARAADLSKYVPLSDEGKAAMTPEMKPDEFIAALLERKLIADSLHFLAHVLPKRQSVFWAMSCARQSRGNAEPAAEAALKAAEKWIADPSEQNRQECLAAANAADTTTPAGATALAAYYSSGLPQGEDARANAKAYFMTARLVSAVVSLAAVEGDREQAMARFDGFLMKGVEIYKRTTSK